MIWYRVTMCLDLYCSHQQNSEKSQLTFRFAFVLSMYGSVCQIQIDCSQIDIHVACDSLSAVS